MTPLPLIRSALTLAALLIATGTPAQTVLTGDRVDGTPVIDKLDVADLAPGQVHRFWFRVTDNAIGQGWYVPVVVVRGAKPGPKLLLTAAIHGDELNGVDVIHRLVNRIDPAALSGSIVAIPGLNTPGLLHHTRAFTPGDGRDGENLNRIMPGDPKSTDRADRYATRLWSQLMRPNADTAIDLHTQSRGTAYPMYAFAGSPRAREIAELIGPDMIKLDPGIKGTVETEMLKSGVPAITLELNRPEMFDRVVIGRAVDGVLRVMVDMKMLAPGSAPPRTKDPIVGDSLATVRTSRGGYATLLVDLGDRVAKGQTVATLADPFGRTLETLTAPQAGWVSSIATDPLRDPGDTLMRILFLAPTRAADSDRPVTKAGPALAR
ncbi:MAG: succinylglutamate desuccinylase [Sphingobium sp.]|nr:succinylglutamate desuccinylase [Sphingobium sp.]